MYTHNRVEERKLLQPYRVHSGGFSSLPCRLSGAAPWPLLCPHSHQRPNSARKAHLLQHRHKYSLSDGERYLFSFLLGTNSNVLISPISMPSAISRTFSMTCEPYLCGSNRNRFRTGRTGAPHTQTHKLFIMRNGN